MANPSQLETPFLLTSGVSIPAVVFVFGFACLAVVSQTATASTDVPTALHNAERVLLENGLRIVLKPRSVSRSVSMRLAVDIGNWDFPCGRQQTAHFLEHLLFTGTTDHEESELDALIESHGGQWNATTRFEETVYEIDIHSQHADVALDTLFEIMARSKILTEDVLRSRDIVHREMGGKPSAARRWLYGLGFGKTAWSSARELLAKDTNAGCSDLESADGITREEILAAYRTYYVPANMMLVVVGDFESQQMLARIRNTFGKLPHGAVPKRAKTDIISSDRRLVVNSHFSPVLDGDALVALVFKVPGWGSRDRYALQVLQAYLHKRLYDELRVVRGLAYAPGAETIFRRRFGLIVALADVYVEDMDTAINVMDGEIRQVLQGRLDESQVEEIKRGLLLSEARKYERNADIAERFVESRFSFASEGEFADEASRIGEVTAEDMGRVAREYLHIDRGVVVRIAPTFTYTELVSYGGTSLLVAILLGLGHWLRRSRRRRLRRAFYAGRRYA